MTGPLPTPPERRRRPLTKRDRDAFLAALSAGFSVTHAAETVGRHRRRLYEARETDTEFRDAWDDAFEAGMDRLEDELRRRALGYDEDTFDGDGNLIRRVRRYDTPALVARLKAGRPETYRDNARVELTGRGGGPLELSADYTPTTIADVARLAHELGLLDDLDEIDGEAVEAADPPELEAS